MKPISNSSKIQPIEEDPYLIDHSFHFRLTLGICLIVIGILLKVAYHYYMLKTKQEPLSDMVFGG